MLERPNGGGCPGRQRSVRSIRRVVPRARSASPQTRVHVAIIADLADESIQCGASGRGATVTQRTGPGESDRAHRSPRATAASCSRTTTTTDEPRRLATLAGNRAGNRHLGRMVVAAGRALHVTDAYRAHAARHPDSATHSTAQPSPSDVTPCWPETRTPRNHADIADVGVPSCAMGTGQWAVPDLNRGPQHFQCCALPTELTALRPLAMSAKVGREGSSRPRPGQGEAHIGRLPLPWTGNHPPAVQLGGVHPPPDRTLR